MERIDYNAIQREIDKNRDNIDNGSYDIYEFCSYIQKKHIEPLYPESVHLVNENPFADLLFSMLEINNLELY